MESGCQVQAIYDFKGTEPSELTLNTGDIIEVVSKLNDNWLQGTHNGVTGAFPSNFVTLLSNNTPKQVTAIEEFIATSNGDLGFQKGDIITVLDKVDDNWWRGQIGNTTGIFPVTYVQEHTSNNSQGDAALQTVKALQDVTGQLQEELTFKKDDVITITETIDSDWYRGTLNGVSGLVPSFCVQLIKDCTDSDTAVDYIRVNDNLRRSLRGELSDHVKHKAPTDAKSTDVPWATSLYPFSAEGPGELSFMDGEKIVLTRRIDEQWLEGNIDGKVGVFPANYVQIVVDVPKVGLSETEQMISQTNQQHTDVNDKCKDMQGKALYNFNADTDQDLPLRCGEIITIVEKVDADWYEARNSSGQVGYCPVNYVELCPGKPKKRLAPKPPIKAVPPSPCVTSDITVKEQTTTVLQPLDPMPTQTLAPVLAPSLTPAPAPILTPTPAPAPTKAPTSALSSAPPVTSTISDSTALITSPTGSKPKPALKPKPTSPLKEHTTAIHGEGDGISPNVDLNAVHGESDAASPNVDDLFGDTAPTVDPLLPSVFRPGGSTYKHVSFIPKGLSSSNSVDSSKGDTLHRQDAIRSPPQTDLSFFDDAVLQPTTVQCNAESSMLPLPQKTLLDASPLIETSGDILAPLNAAPVIAKTSNFDPLAPKPFTPGAPKGVKSVQGPTVGGSKSTSSDFDPFGTAVPLQSKMLHSVPPPVPSSAPSARPTLETKLRSISQISQDLDDFFGTSDNYTSKVSTLDSIESTPSETLTPQPPTFVPFTQVSAAPPPIPPRQPSPNPFSATSVTDSLKHFNPFAASESSQQSQSAITELQHSSSISSPDQIPYQVVPKWHSKNYSIDSVTSEYSDDGAGYYHGLNFSINPAPVHNEEQGPFSFKLPPPPSSPRRTRLASDERPKSPKYNQKTAVPRPKSKKTSEDGGLLSLSTPPASRRNNINKLKVSEAIESFEWNVGELQRKDTIEDETDMPPPSHAPPSLLIDVDNEVAALTGGSGTVSESSTSAVDDLLGFGIDTFSSSPQTVSSNVAKPSRPAPPAPQKVEPSIPSVKSDIALSPCRTVTVEVTLTFESEDLFALGKAPPAGRPPPPKKLPPGRPAPPKMRPQTILEEDLLGPMRPGTRRMQESEEIITNLESRLRELDVEIFAKKEEIQRLEQMMKVVSDENCDEVKHQLEACVSEVDILRNEETKLTAELRDLKPDPVADLKKKNEEMRNKVIDELMKTERDYVKDIKLCYDGFIGSLKDQKFQTLLVRAIAAQQEANQEDNKKQNNRPIAKGIELDILFGNVEKVIDVSERFLETLEENVARQPTENQVAGQCFINYSEELEDIYSHYCRNHDDAIALLEKYEDNPEIQEYINDGLAVVRQSTNCWDLASFLIKPVQRILKYPLLLNEMIKVTEDDHADKHNLLVAINTMTDVATAINEFKRRKDLVMKYRKSDVDSISNKLGKLSLHSIRKKSQRMNQRLTQMTGLVTQTVDEKFNEEERKFRDLEKTIKIFVKDVNSYLEKLQESTSSQAVVAEDIADYYANQANLDEVAKYSKSQRDLANKLYKNYTLFVQQRVVSPLNSLLIMFQGPHKLIQKRFDKLLDYDSVLHKAEKGSKEKAKSKIKDKDSKEDLEKELEKLESPMSPTSKIGHKEKHSKEAKDERQMAKKNYSAMNTQLLDELPKLYSLSVTLFKECVQSFIEAERDHFDATLKHLYPLLKLPMILDSTREDILDSFSLKHQDASEKMMVFSFVPRNFDKKGEKVDRKSSRKSIIGQATPPKNHHSAMQTETHRTQLLSNYGSDQLYKLSLGYTARDSMDISCNRGDMVAVIKQQDPMGGNDKWYVDNGVTQGFIASSILEPCSDVDLREAPLASISDLSNSSQSQIDYVSDEDYRQQLPEYYYSEWPFEANGPNEISLDEGTVVMIVNKHDIEGNLEWWLVDKNGIQGYVPANYLTKID